MKITLSVQMRRLHRAQERVSHSQTIRHDRIDVFDAQNVVSDQPPTLVENRILKVICLTSLVVRKALVEV